MTKSPIPLRADDLTLFARSLSRQLGDASPSHLTLMNMIARSAGFQNVQHMRSVTAAEKRLDRTVEAPAIDARLVERTLHQFDEAGRLRRWPSKRSVQNLALWGLWATVPANESLTERSVNARLMGEHCFEDTATLRRAMVSCGLLTRKRDGTDYRRVEQKPPADAKALIQGLSARRRARNLVMDHA
ncbi:MAG: DUF2087 domain-containing protein [Pseudomonadota bacterium]